ncbi:DOMON-like domain-containing protein [Alkalinema sp. FACHB-956]|uniref:DOMON-like domain-containing protein n=1 Tax=Alkalinema sp. FACHB-956 TaxID=2692768 RepID=UPI00168A1553|nr:DOMON-like domain-containing protein [Alkalinema sp. FACHB-956]MBD2329378.1 DOMON-like domain-containing protein [Alkalinema sp. FACHB-956]
MMQSFMLKPFTESGSQSSPPNRQLTGTIDRRDNILALHYSLQGLLDSQDLLDSLAIAPPANCPERRDNLWETTCFEFFLGLPNSPQYWEFNLSPSGHWNVYRFTDYRQGMEPETQITSLPFQLKQWSNQLELAVEFDLASILSITQSLDVGITTVIQDKSGTVTYWALTHLGEQADFHRRDSFILTI